MTLKDEMQKMGLTRMSEVAILEWVETARGKKQGLLERGLRVDDEQGVLDTLTGLVRQTDRTSNG